MIHHPTCYFFPNKLCPNNLAAWGRRWKARKGGLGTEDRPRA